MPACCPRCVWPLQPALARGKADPSVHALFPLLPSSPATACATIHACAGCPTANLSLLFLRFHLHAWHAQGVCKRKAHGPHCADSGTAGAGNEAPSRRRAVCDSHVHSQPQAVNVLNVIINRQQQLLRRGQGLHRGARLRARHGQLHILSQRGVLRAAAVAQAGAHQHLPRSGCTQKVELVGPRHGKQRALGRRGARRGSAWVARACWASRANQASLRLGLFPAACQHPCSGSSSTGISAAGHACAFSGTCSQRTCRPCSGSAEGSAASSDRRIHWSSSGGRPSSISSFSISASASGGASGAGAASPTSRSRHS